ncbi:cytochrome P450 [Saccharopolyspora sp. NPDC049426]|uniref:cytochrome P450 n=1 Tax=Saccharopolyspora sp. NPDC049426 TaxID=3155652 RepID=UPI00341A072C
MTCPAEKWGIDPGKFWMRGAAPESPVRFDDETGVWNVYGHAEAVQALGDPGTFSSDIARVLRMEGENPLQEGNLLQLDPPRHRELRNLVSRAFTPKVVNDLEPRIAELTAELLEPLGDEFDLISALAHPLPVIVIAELLGVPAGDRAQFRTWADGLLTTEAEFNAREIDTESDEAARQLRMVTEMRDYLLGHAAERRRRPRRDLLTDLVQAEVDGERLSDDEIVNFASVLLLAGHITTTLLLGNTVLCLDEHPDQLAAVRDDRALLPSAIEESLRYLSPFAVVYRATTRATEIGEREVPADQVIAVRLSAANWDARRFDSPATFDVHRDPNPHLGFGRGIHFCLGAPLARLEGRIALGLLLDHFPQLSTDPRRPPTFMRSYDINGVNELPLLSGVRSRSARGWT